MSNFNNTSYTTKMTVKEAAIANRLFNSYAAMYNFASDANDTAINGLTFAVAESVNEYENGKYYLVSGAGTNNVVFERILTSNDIKVNDALSASTNSSGLTISLKESEVVPGIYNTLHINEYGLAVSGTNKNYGDITSATTTNSGVTININGDTLEFGHKVGNAVINNALLKFTIDDFGHVVTTSAVTASDLPSHTHNQYISGITSSNSGITVSKSNGVVNLQHEAGKLIPLSFVKIQTNERGHVVNSSAVTASDLPSHTHTLSSLTDTENLISGVTDSPSINLTLTNSVLSGDVTINTATTYTLSSVTPEVLKQNIISASPQGLVALSWCEIDEANNELIFCNTNGKSSMPLSGVGRYTNLVNASEGPFQIDRFDGETILDLVVQSGITPNQPYREVVFNKYGIATSGTSDNWQFNQKVEVNNNISAKQFFNIIATDYIENNKNITNDDINAIDSVNFISYNFKSDAVDIKRYGVWEYNLRYGYFKDLITQNTNGYNSVDIISLLALKLHSLTKTYNDMLSTLTNRIDTITISFDHEEEIVYFPTSALISGFTFYNFPNNSSSVDMYIGDSATATTLTHSTSAMTINADSFLRFRIDSSLVVPGTLRCFTFQKKYNIN